MIDQNPSEDELMSFYNIPTMRPRSLDDLNLNSQDHYDPEQIAQLSEDERFNLLSKLINGEDVEDGPKGHRSSRSDFEDPLAGRGSNIYKQLVQKQVISSASDSELAQYLISSPSFNSKQFLTTIHSQTPIEDLTAALDRLEHNIHSQTSELKGVIDSNFIKFISCKNSIDVILTDFKNQKSKLQKQRDGSKVFNPNRHALLNRDANASLSSVLEDSINNLNTNSSLIIRPIAETKLKESKMQRLIDFIKIHQDFFDLPNKLIGYISNHMHDAFIEDYNQFLHNKQSFLAYQKTKYTGEFARLTQQKDFKAIEQLKQDQLMINTSIYKVFDEVDNIIEHYKKRIFKELLTLDFEVSEKSADNNHFLALTDKLYQLDNSNTDNPIYDFLMNQLDSLDEELEYQIAKFDSKFSMMQRKLNDYINSLPDSRKNGSNIKYISDKYDEIEDYLVTSNDTSIERYLDESMASGSAKNGTDLISIFQSSESLDLSIINETWLVLNNFINYLNDLFTRNLRKFTNNYKHYYSYNIDFDGKIRDKFVSMVEKLNVILTTLFEDDENGANNNQLESSPKNYKQFLPNFTNSLSAMFYLGGIQNKINELLSNLGEFVGTVGNLSSSTDTNKIVKNLRNGSSKINQKILEATCSVWVNDCSQLFDLESWEIRESINDKSMDGSFTKLMNIIECYQSYILYELKQLITNDIKSEFKIVSTYPSKRILVSIEIQFMRSLNRIIDSIMKKYTIERNIGKNEDGTYKVLTMNNFDKLSRSIYPRLIQKFDKLFDKSLSTQNLKLFADIDKASLTIFDDIINREKVWLTAKVNKYFSNCRDNTVIKPSKMKVDGFIYEILIHYVKLTHKVKPITSGEIFVSIVNELQMHLVKNILDNLRATNDLTANELINLKLDSNFFMEVFEISSSLKFNDQTFKSLEILLNTIEEKLGDSSYSKTKFKQVLETNLRDSESQFSCF